MIDLPPADVDSTTVVQATSEAVTANSHTAASVDGLDVCLELDLDDEARLALHAD